MCRDSPITAQVFPPWHRSPRRRPGPQGGFFSRLCCSKVSHDPCLHLSVSPFLRCRLSLCPLVTPTRVVDVTLWSAFHWYGQNSNFQAFYMWIANWKALAMLYSLLETLYSVISTVLVLNACLAYPSCLLSLHECNVWVNVLDFVFQISSGKHCFCRLLHSEGISIGRDIFMAN